MVREEGPGVDGERPTLRQRGEAGDEIPAVRVIPEDGAPLEPPHHHVVEGVRGIQAGLTGHGEEYASKI